MRSQERRIGQSVSAAGYRDTYLDGAHWPAWRSATVRCGLAAVGWCNGLGFTDTRDVKVNHKLGCIGRRCDGDVGDVAVLVEGDHHVRADQQLAVDVMRVRREHGGSDDTPPGG